MTSAQETRVLLVVNPGSRRGARLARPAARELERAGCRCDAFFTEKAGGSAAIIASRAPEYDFVFTLGGDGTVMEVLGALPPGGPPVGVLHGGTGNLIAQALGVPRRLQLAVPALLNGRVARIDLGRLGDGRRFAVAAGVGIDASMVAETPHAFKRRLGIAAYIVFGARALLRFERFSVRVDVDGTIHEQRASAVLVANFGSLLNDFVRLGDGIEYDDGLLNVCVFCPQNMRDAARITRRLLLRDFRPDPCLWYAAGRRISVATDPPRDVQADGELLGSTPFTAEVEPLRAAVLIPARQ